MRPAGAKFAPVPPYLRWMDRLIVDQVVSGSRLEEPHLFYVMNATLAVTHRRGYVDVSLDEGERRAQEFLARKKADPAIRVRR